jgi:hypothetical protein
MTEWQKIGTIGVDAGMCWIGDPCYIIGKDATESWDTWRDFLRDLGRPYKGFKSFPYKMGHEGRGVVVDSGFGDGVYPVMARFDSGCRVAEVRVIFIREDEDKENCDDDYDP